MEQYLGTGRRKTAVARVYLRPGRGKITINSKTLEDYFAKHPSIGETVRQALRETHTLSKYDLVINVQGGGTTGQAEAMRHGIARALQSANPAYRPALKAAGFLTRDAREVERKKYGKHKARRSCQFSKR
jgi:small subunit ribosomal protein S9